MIICVECGTKVPTSKAKGSFKCPLCEGCFERLFKGDYWAYSEYLAQHLAGG